MLSLYRIIENVNSILYFNKGSGNMVLMKANPKLVE